jgi:ferric-dicitrate binding protein FerR (iron transport regulator)
MHEPTIKELLKLYEEGKATEEQRRRVEEYLAWHREQSPESMKEPVDETDPLEEILSKIRVAREQAGEGVMQEPVGEEAPVYEMEGGGRRRRYAWAAAASVAVIMAGIFLLSRNTHQPMPVQVATIYKTVQANAGERVHLLLSDSSEVWLNAGARIRYAQPFGDSMRRVELLDGEAYFQIHSDARRGFEVSSDRMVTKVLGTSFNVKAYRQSQQMSVAISSGKVAVSAGREGAMIFTAGQLARYNTVTGRLSRGTIAVEKIQDWKGGRFDFVDESLGDIAIELEHYYNAKIDFKYPGLRKYAVSASFSHQTPLKDILTTLSLLNQNHVTQTDAQHYVIH